MTQGIIERPRLPAAPLYPRLRLLTHVLLGVQAVGMVAFAARMTLAPGAHRTDFLTFYESGRHALHGLSLYPPLSSLPAVADPTRFAPFVYPPPLAFAIVPLALLPLAVANAVFFGLGIAATLLGLRLLGVQDKVCYALAFSSVPVLAAPSNGSISAFLFLGVAAAWRYRDRVWPAAALVAAVVVAKLFLWPVWLWLVWTRRYRAALLSAVLAIAATVAAWGATGFGGLGAYPQLLSRLTELTGINSYSFYALERAFAVPASLAQVGVFAVGAVAVLLARRFFAGEVRDEWIFMLAVGLSLLLTPILWSHYLILLFVPIAIARPALARLWMLPLLFWFDADAWSFGEPARIAPVLALSAFLVVSSLRSVR